MCGIIGWKKWENKIVSLEKQNAKRGGYSTGCYNYFIAKSEKKKGTKFYEFVHTSIVQYRISTTNTNEWNPLENYPLEYNEWKLFGNGVINEAWYKKAKGDFKINNDLYYVLKGIVKKGWSFLEEVEGCFALVIINPKNEVYIVRKDYPLLYDNNIISSIPFPGGQELEQGIVKGWTNRMEKKLSFEKTYEV